MPFVVKGVDVTSSALSEPGWIVIHDFPGSSSNLDELRQEITLALGLPVRGTSSRQVWERNVALHATDQSEPCTCARIPVILSLSPNHSISTSDRFTVTAMPYNPRVYCGEERGVLTMDAALGLTEVLGLTSPVHGVQLTRGDVYGKIELLPSL